MLSITHNHSQRGWGRRIPTLHGRFQFATCMVLTAQCPGLSKCIIASLFSVIMAVFSIIIVAEDDMECT